jgi:hypothetical protein
VKARFLVLVSGKSSLEDFSRWTNPYFSSSRTPLYLTVYFIPSFLLFHQTISFFHPIKKNSINQASYNILNIQDRDVDLKFTKIKDSLSTPYVNEPASPFSSFPIESVCSQNRSLGPLHPTCSLA